MKFNKLKLRQLGMSHTFNEILMAELIKQLKDKDNDRTRCNTGRRLLHRF